MKQERALLQQTDKINDLLARYGVKFGIYKNNTFKEQLFPFDSIPRIIEHSYLPFYEEDMAYVLEHFDDLALIKW